MADIFHTFFGISGLSLLGYFSNKNNNENNNKLKNENNERNDNEDEEQSKTNNIEVNVNISKTNFENYDGIDPTYALPEKIVKKLGLKKQILGTI